MENIKCRSVIVCEIIAHLLVIVQNNKRCTVQGIKIKKKKFLCCGWLAQDPVLAVHTAVPCTGATRCSRGHHKGRNRHPGWQVFTNITQKSAGSFFKAREKYSRQRCKPTTRLHGVITQNTYKYRNSSSNDPLIGNYAKKKKDKELLEIRLIFCKWHTSLWARQAMYV